MQLVHQVVTADGVTWCFLTRMQCLALGPAGSEGHCHIPCTDAIYFFQNYLPLSSAASLELFPC